MILYHQNNSYLKLQSSFNIFCRSPNDVSLSVFNIALSSFPLNIGLSSFPLNIALSSFPLPARHCLKSCTEEKGKFLLVIKHMSVPEDNRTLLLTKEIHDCYRPSGTVRSTKFRQL